MHWYCTVVDLLIYIHMYRSIQIYVYLCVRFGMCEPGGLSRVGCCSHCFRSVLSPVVSPQMPAERRATIQPDWLCCSVGLFSSHSFLQNGPFTQWDDWLRDSTCSNCWSPRKLLNVRRFVYCNNAAGIRKFWERDRSLQEPVPLPAQQSRVRGWWDFGELCST